MPHSRKDQRNLFRSPTPAIDQRERKRPSAETQAAPLSPNQERQLVAKPKPAKDFFLGRTRFSPLELLLQKDRFRRDRARR